MGEGLSKLSNSVEMRFNYHPDEIREIVDIEIDKITKALENIEQIPVNQATFKNIVIPLSLVQARSQNVTQVIPFLQNVAINPDVREASRQAEEKMNDFLTSICMRPKLYEQLKRIENVERDSLNDLDTRLLDSHLDSYESHGISQTSRRRKYLQELEHQKNHLMIEFERNMTEDQSHVILRTRDLEGCTDEFIERTHLKKQPGHHKITSKHPDVSHILINCEIDSTRRLVKELSDLRCQENLQIMEKLHEVRTNLAQANGHPHSSDYKLSSETIKNSTNVVKFLDQVLEHLDQHTQRYVEELERFKTQCLRENQAGRKRKRFNQEERTPLEPFDYSYYHNKYLEKYYQVNHEKLAEYFPAEHVVNEMLRFYGELFSLDFQEVPKNHFEAWHSDVTYYLVKDRNSYETIGSFYFDLYPRDGKYTHYAMWDLIGGYQETDGTQIRPVAAMVGNFPAPVGDVPSLLVHDEVTTMFHEFGHVIHGICGGYKSRYYEMSGTNVERDFVEAPSQMKEQWVWEPIVLKRISKHYRTGEPLPDELINNLVRSRYVGASREWTRLAAMSKVDQLIHTRKRLTSDQMVTLMGDIMNEALYQNVGAPNRLASWAHMGSYDYDSQYYSYVWTMVIAADLYSRFKNDPLNPKIGMEYRRKILEPGGTKSGWSMIRDFLGRKPSLESFLTNYIGLEINASNAKKLKLHVNKKRKT